MSSVPSLFDAFYVRKNAPDNLVEKLQEDEVKISDRGRWGWGKGGVVVNQRHDRSRGAVDASVRWKQIDGQMDNNKGAIAKVSEENKFAEIRNKTHKDWFITKHSRKNGKKIVIN